MNLRTLSDSEFLRYADTQIDDLTSSDIEREALRRLEAAEQRMQNAEGFPALADEYSLTADEVRSMVEAHPGTHEEIVGLLAALADKGIESPKALTAFLQHLDKAGITEPDELKAELELATKFKSLANDAGDLFNRLHTLTEATQED